MWIGATVHDETLNRPTLTSTGYNATVRARVCQGCHVTLPTSAASRPETEAAPGLCECCGRVLFWG